MEQSLRLAIGNIFRFGDTDIFPIPIENYILHDRADDVIRFCVEKVHREFPDYLHSNPPSNLEGLSPAGYTGYRWATQIDPVWNLYFLACVIEIGNDIEGARLSPDFVSAYRFKPDLDTSKLFDINVDWRHFQKRSQLIAATPDPGNREENKYSHVLICDIADFYSRIYQHKMDNDLDRLGTGTDIPWRIKKLYDAFTGLPSYGLPIGGPAARLLAELLLNTVDRLLWSEGITFCRYCDDYHIFAQSKSEAYRHLVFLAEKLLSMEGLALQKSKSRVMSVNEFISNSNTLLEEPEHPERAEFMRLRLKFDPYSSTAVADYEALRTEITRFDILDLLTKELNKSHIHRAAASHIVNAVRFLNMEDRGRACLAIANSLDVMAPIFPLAMRTLRDLMPNLQDGAKVKLCEQLRHVIESRSHLVAVETNMAYAIRVLAQYHCAENETLFGRIYRQPISPLVRKDIVIAMARWGCAYFIEDAKNAFTQESPWVQRALIVASYSIGDSGKHWRRSLRNIDGFNRIVKDWISNRVESHEMSTLPL